MYVDRRERDSGLGGSQYYEDGLEDALEAAEDGGGGGSVKRRGEEKIVKLECRGVRNKDLRST